jgi:hypothetical protein
MDVREGGATLILRSECGLNDQARCPAKDRSGAAKDRQLMALHVYLEQVNDDVAWQFIIQSYDSDGCPLPHGRDADDLQELGVWRVQRVEI